MAREADAITMEVGGREVVVTHPGKLLIPQAKLSKLDLVNYYVAVAEGALRGAGGRPCVLVRYPNGIGEEFFFQKRAHRGRDRAARGGRPGLDGQPRLPGTASAPGAR